jgi:hypothetical protein
MTFTLLTIACCTAAITAVYVLVAKAEPAEALAGETTLSNSADPATETMASGHHQTPATRTEWQLTTVTALSDAEELLDMLENQGIEERELVVMGNSCFAVRWR